jgi:hypothetical protein
MYALVDQAHRFDKDVLYFILVVLMGLVGESRRSSADLAITDSYLALSALVSSTLCTCSPNHYLFTKPLLVHPTT